MIFVQLWTFAYVQLLNKPYENEVFLREQKLPLKCCQHLKMLTYFGKGFRPFHTSNIGSVGQRITKLLAVKVRGFKKSLPPARVEPWTTGSTGARAGRQTFF